MQIKQDRLILEAVVWTLVIKEKKNKKDLWTRGGAAIATMFVCAFAASTVLHGSFWNYKSMFDECGPTGE